VAWISFEESFHFPHQTTEVTLDHVYFTTAKPFRSLPVSTLSKRIFSEVLRDIDLIVSVAHATGAAPETSASTLESRAALVRETCRLLGLSNVEIGNKYILITGRLANYRIHPGSGIVHRVPGAMIPVISDQQTERGRLFLPFAEDDPAAVDILSRVLLFANDEAIRDPLIAKAIRSS
jgi:hypothetical protein